MRSPGKARKRFVQKVNLQSLAAGKTERYRFRSGQQSSCIASRRSFHDILTWFRPMNWSEPAPPISRPSQPTRLSCMLFESRTPERWGPPCTLLWGLLPWPSRLHAAWSGKMWRKYQENEGRAQNWPRTCPPPLFAGTIPKKKDGKRKKHKTKINGNHKSKSNNDGHGDELSAD